jgi:hypothetical protein
MDMFRGMRTYYSKEIDEISDLRDIAADACLRERRLTLSILDELIAAVTFMGVMLLLTSILWAMSNQQKFDSATCHRPKPR